MDQEKSEQAGSSTAEGAADQAEKASTPDAGRDDGASLSEHLIKSFGHDGEAKDFDPGDEPEEDAALAESQESTDPGDESDPGQDDDDEGDADTDSEDTPEDEDADAVVAKDSDESEDAESDDGELTDEELTKRPRKVQKRFKKLLRQRAELRDRVQTLEPAAEQYQQILSFMQQAQIVPERMVELYQFAALENSDPKRALEMLQARANSLQASLGLSLPDDLKQKVEDGLVDEEYAKQLSQERAQLQRQGEQLQRRQQFTQQEQQMQLRAQVADAVNAWEAGVRDRDPDYSRLKESFVRTALENMVLQHGLPESPQVGVQWAEKALADVTARLGPVQAPKPPVEPMRSGGARRQVTTIAPPRSMLEAVKRGVEQAT